MNHHENNIYSLLCNWQRIIAEKGFADARKYFSITEKEDLHL